MSESEDPDFEAIDQTHEKAFKLAQILFEEGDYKKSLEILIALEKQDLKE
jgi:thioredoxin-like negative regulator of GroEL